MNPDDKAEMFEFLKRVAQGLAGAVGKMCEVVIHDFNDAEHSIIAIENGYVTGRKVGDSFGVLGLQVLRDPPKGDLINYRTETKDGRLLRSSSLFLRDKKGDMFGALCVNLDVTEVAKAQKVLEDLTSSLRGVIDEGFETSVDEALSLLINEAIRTTGKESDAMDREDRIRVIYLLESKGAFLIRYSIDRVAESLNISKFTVYNYLEEVKSRRGINQESPQEKQSASNPGSR